MSSKSKSFRFYFYVAFAFVFAFANAANVFAACSLNTNLIVNPDAEADQSAPGNNSDYDVFGWEPETGAFTVTKYGAAGGFPTVSDPGPANRGNFFFSGGNGGTTSSGTQTINLTDCAAQIDAGALAFNLNGFLGGFGNSDENAQLTLNFKNASNTTVGTAGIGPVFAADRNNQTGLLQRAASGTIPAGTRSVEAILLMTYISGTDNDGYADNLSFTVANPIVGGGQIIYSRAPNGSIDGNSATVWAINPDGTNDHQITTGDEPRLSPDGNYLLFRRKPGFGNGQNYQDNLWIRNLTTGAESLIYNNSDYIVSYDFAPTGGKLYFDYGCAIDKIDYDGSNQQTIDSNCYDDAPTARKTDGLLAFHGFNGEIFTLNTNGSNRQAVPNTNTGNNYAPEWSNDGQFIYYGHYDGSSAYPYNYDSLYKIKPDGTGKVLLKTLTGSDRFSTAGVESADGAKMYLPANIGGVTGIYTVSTDGGGTISAPIAAGSEVDFVGGIAPASVPVPSGLIGWFAGDGDARDISGNANDGSPINSTFVIGKIGQAFSFNGANASVQIPDNAALKPANLTVETWVKFNSLDSTVLGGASAGSQYLVFKQNSRSDRFEGYDLQKTRDAQGDKFAFAISSASGQQASVVSTTLISTGVFYHVAATYDGSQLKLYVNGNLESAAAANTALDYGTQPLYLGRSGNGGFDGFLSGVLDETSLYSRALTAAEIQSIYNAGTGGKIKQAATAAGANSQSMVNDATLTFANISTAGTTTDVTIDPTTAGALPNGLTQTGLAYDISTTAVYSGAIMECFHIPAIADRTVFSQLKVLHQEGGTLVDRTVSYTFGTRMICGQTTTLSPFVIANGLTPTAAGALISGRVSAGGKRNLANARVTLTGTDGEKRTVLTNSFGNFTFTDVTAGSTYIVNVSAKSYLFAPQVVSINGDLKGLTFTPIQSN